MHKAKLSMVGKTAETGCVPDKGMSPTNDKKMKASDVSCGLAHEFIVALAKAGWEIPDIDAMIKNEDNCRGVLAFLREDAEINYTIDCSAAPFCPDGWQILPPEEQIPTRFTGKLKWDRQAQKETFYSLVNEVTFNKWVRGDKLYKQLVESRAVVLPANVLDYLLAYPYLIPEEWKGKGVYFWGTIYKRPEKHYPRLETRCVRCLFWNAREWRWNSQSLSLDFLSTSPPLLASQS